MVVVDVEAVVELILKLGCTEVEDNHKTINWHKDQRRRHGVRVFSRVSSLRATRASSHTRMTGRRSFQSRQSVAAMRCCMVVGLIESRVRIGIVGEDIEETRSRGPARSRYGEEREYRDEEVIIARSGNRDRDRDRDRHRGGREVIEEEEIRVQRGDRERDRDRHHGGREVVEKQKEPWPATGKGLSRKVQTASHPYLPTNLLLTSRYLL